MVFSRLICSEIDSLLFFSRLTTVYVFWLSTIISIKSHCFYQAVREQLVQMMFETFNISGFYASEQAVLSLYAVGRISGCTVDIGHGKIGMCT